MKVFIGWSGPRSKEVAEALKDWLPDVIHSVVPFISSDIEKGKESVHVLRSELEKSNFGILCLTKDNCIKPWVLFEAGALSKVLENAAVCPYLIDMEPEDLPQPLWFFQAAKADEKGTQELIRSLNAASEIVLSGQQIRRSFEKWWPDLEPRLKSKAKPVGPPASAQAFHLINVKTLTVLRALGVPHKNGELLEVGNYSGEEREIWYCHQVEKRYYAIVSSHTGQCIDVEGNSTAEQAKIHQWEFQNGENQKWALALQKDCSYKLRAKHSGRYMAETDRGIRQMSEADSRSQKWWLTPVFTY
jgi:Ricin-type beta-trefoil lectin domain-like/TIR domain